MGNDKKNTTSYTPRLRHVGFYLYEGDPVDTALHSAFAGIRKRKVSDFVKQVLYTALCGSGAGGAKPIDFFLNPPMTQEKLSPASTVSSPVENTQRQISSQSGPPPLRRREQSAVLPVSTHSTTGLSVIEIADGEIPVENEDQSGSLMGMIQ